MNRTTIAALMGLALATAPAAQAKEAALGYTFVEARLAYTQVDLLGPSELTVNGSGGGIAGSYAFGNTGLFATGSFDTVEADAADVSIDRGSLGLGYAVAIDETFHVLLEGKALRYKGDDGFDSYSVNGWQGTVGLRKLFAGNLETTIKAGTIKVDDDLVLLYDGAIVELGARWHADRLWSFGIDGQFTKDDRTAFLSARATF